MNNILYVFLLSSFFSFGQIQKFPLYKLGIKFSKPSDFSLITDDKFKEVKGDLLSNISLCSGLNNYSESSFKYNYMAIFINRKNYNEAISFSKWPKFQNANKKISDFLSKFCVTIKDWNYSIVSESKGFCNFGEFSSLIIKIKNQNSEYFSDNYFFEFNDAFYQVSIAKPSYDKISNLEIINSIEYLFSENHIKNYDWIYSLITKKNYHDAWSLVSEEILSDTSKPYPIMLRAHISFLMKDYVRTLYDATRSYSLDSTDLNSLMLKAMSFFYLNQFNDAVLTLRNVIFKYTLLDVLNLANNYIFSLTEVYGVSGDIYMKQGNYNLALYNYDMALLYAYDSASIADIYNNKGVLEASLNKSPHKAIIFYGKALSYYPINLVQKRCEAYFNRGLSYVKQDKHILAIQDFSTSFNYNNKFVKSLKARASSYVFIGEYKLAIIDCNKILSMKDSEYTNLAYYYRGISKLALNDSSGCLDLMMAKKLGHNVPKKMLDYCY